MAPRPVTSPERLVGFDLEIARIMPAEAQDLWAYAPLGITCAGLAFGDGRLYEVYSGIAQMTREACQALVQRLLALVDEGYTLVTWNGCGFDLRVLAEESGMVAECGRLALGHVDLMVHVTFRKGHYVSLAKALEGARLPGKHKAITLADGSVVSNPGVNAPALWAAGEYAPILAYLEQDCEQVLALAQDVLKRKRIDWRANSGSPQSVAISSLASVEECCKFPKPDVSWMSSPPRREEFLGWME